MARHEDVAVTADWVQLTAGDVTAIRVQNPSPYPVLLQATSGATAPASAQGAVTLRSGFAFSDELAVWWPGVAEPARLWARTLDPLPVVVSVSHA